MGLIRDRIVAMTEQHKGTAILQISYADDDTVTLRGTVNLSCNVLADALDVLDELRVRYANVAVPRNVEEAMLQKLLQRKNVVQISQET